MARLVSQPDRLGSVPFQLYIVQPIAPSKLAPSHEAFANHLELLDKQARQFELDNSTWLATHWSYLHSAAPDYRTTYTYNLKAQFDGMPGISSQCISTAIRAGDQLIVTFPLHQNANIPSSLTISATSFTTVPLNVSYGPIHIATIRDQSTQPLILQTTKGKPGVSLATS